MSANDRFKPLTDDQIGTMCDQGCSSADWSKVRVAPGFNPVRVRNTHFADDVRIGAQIGSAGSTVSGVDKVAGIFNAYIADCTIGDNVHIANIGVHLAHYDIGEGACIENVGVMETRRGATFGNGVEVEALNEAGGREVILFNELSSQFAHLMCLHRYRPKLIERLDAIARAAADRVKADRGRVDAGADIRNVNQIVDVNVDAHARIHGAASLVNGSILSSGEAPTIIGDSVQAEDFIIAEASEVTGGAIISKTYVGQGCQMGKQFSAENSLFFANCEGFHGEACSIFAGPYTVTHHKSTLLIAGLFSFYNAGSGTNQSNHLYKLGPVHEGKLERGSKTGSFAYMMWPCRVGPFSVVLGKHKATFDAADFPFSILDATPQGQCSLVPGINLATVGTVRDGAKWPTRDRRKGPIKRDRLSFDVLSPLTVGRMIAASAKLRQLQQSTDKSVETVSVNGAQIKRVLLRSGQKFYRPGIELYLLEKVFGRLERAEALAPSPDAVLSETWVDIGGLLMPRRRLDDLCAAVERGEIADRDAFTAALDRVQAAGEEDEWCWVRHAYAQYFGKDLDAAADPIAIADAFKTVKVKFLNLILNDATKDFDELMHAGFGQDATPDEAEADFHAVRGEYNGNKFVEQTRGQIEEAEARVERFKRGAARDASVG